jgi:hypothetical protein
MKHVYIKPTTLNRSSKKKNETQLSNGNPEEIVLDLDKANSEIIGLMRG